SWVSVNDCNRLPETAIVPPITARARWKGMKKSPCATKPESNELNGLVSERRKLAEPSCASPPSALAPCTLLMDGISQRLPSIEVNSVEYDGLSILSKCESGKAMKR